MNLHTYQYGSVRKKREGFRIGTARFLPRGVRRDDWQKKGYFDFWLPLLAPDPEAIKEFLGGKMPWTTFARQYRRRMKQKECRHVIELLGGMSLFVPFGLGCYCEDESRCHRSLLKELVTAEAKKRKPGFTALQKGKTGIEIVRYASPVFLRDTLRDGSQGILKRRK